MIWVSAGTAKSGVPMKTIRNGPAWFRGRGFWISIALTASGRLFLARATLARGSSVLGGLGEFPGDAIPLQPRQMIDEQDPVQMVYLMLQTGRQNPVRFDLLGAALAVEISCAH